MDSMGFERLFLPDPQATTALGQRLAPVLRAGDVLLLSGDLGAGKSALARAIIQARLMTPEDVPSPSYTLVQSYQAADTEIWHADLYRLGDPDECRELGLDMAFETALCLVEWPERLGDYVPRRYMLLQLSVEGDGRSLHYRAVGSNWGAALAAIRGES